MCVYCNITMFIVTLPTLGKIAHRCITKHPQMVLKMSNSIVEGSKVGLSLIGVSEIFAHQHNPYAMIIQMLLGMYAYGIDRMNKKEQNDPNLYLFYECLLILNVVLLSRNIKTIPFVPLIYSTKYYRYIKKHIGILKPGVIAIMWAMCCVMIPHFLGNSKDPNQCLQLLGCYFSIYGTSNFADLRDKDEDEDEGIMTIPVMYKENITYMVATFSFIASVFCLLLEFYLRSH